MPAPSPSVAAARARANALKRYRPVDDPVVKAAERDLRVERLAEYIERVVDAAPPLTPEQRDRLALLLRGGDAA